MIRLALIFLPFLFILLPTCYLVGSLVIEKMKLEFNKYLRVCIGFITLIAVFQILYYPAMILQLPSLYITIIGLMIGSIYAIFMGPTSLSVPKGPLSFSTFSIIAFIIGGVVVLLMEYVKNKLGKEE